MKRKSKSIVISGYFGFGNLGDEAVLYSILSSIAKASAHSTVTVLTKNSSALPIINNIKIKGTSRTNPFQILKALLFSDLFISGGGSLLQDATGKRSLIYYCTLTFLAKLFSKKVYIFSNGLGPLKNEKLCKRALQCADSISFRDPDSVKLAKRLLGEDANVSLTADPLFSYPFSKSREFPLYCMKELRGKRYFAVSLRECRESFDLSVVINAVLYYKNQGLIPIFVPMQKDMDLVICQKAAKAVGGTVTDARNIDELYFLLEKAEFAMGMRLHFLLCCAAASTPFAGISYDPKVESCISYLKVGTTVALEELTAKKLIRACEDAKNSFSNSDYCLSRKNMEEAAAMDTNELTTILAEEKEGGSTEVFADT